MVSWEEFWAETLRKAGFAEPPQAQPDDRHDPQPAVTPTSVEPSTAPGPKGSKKKRVVTIVLDSSLPRAAQVASWGLAVMKQAGVRTWEELGPSLQHWPPHVTVTPEQVQLVEPMSYLLGVIAMARPGRHEKTVTLAVCPVCHEWELTTGTYWKQCHLTVGCPGAPVKAPVAKAVVCAAE